ncbi:AAA family ATPase [Labrys neptuniae]|uniref:AAA family ATPase n=1 Tax=Labrys neptuniae TaxID=376174 RepID=A0ABV3PGJ2_9HYPH
MSETNGQEPGNEVEKIRQRVVEEMNRQGLNRADVARAADVASSTTSLWLDGKYAGKNENVAEKFKRWLQVCDDTRAAAVAQAESVPKYVETPTSTLIVQTLAYAQSTPEMVVITAAAGLGKTTSIKYFVSTRRNVYRATMRPRTSGMWSMLQDIAITVGAPDLSGKALDRAIGEKLRRNGRHTLLILDEAQELTDQAVNQLRHFLDEYECGIALVGNDEVYKRFGATEPKEGYGQLHRRIGLKRRILTPQPGDIDAMLDAWKIEDPKQRELLTYIGRKPGTLGQIDKTMRLATILAAGNNRPVDIADIRSAWINRSGEVRS